MKLPSIAILLLRGLEGCGVSNYSRHLQAYLDSVGGVCDIYVLHTKSVGRPHTSSDIRVLPFEATDAPDVIDKINRNYDLALVFSTPPKSAPPHIKDNFVSWLDAITINKWLINHDLHTQSFNRNANFIQAIEACGKTMAYNTDPSLSRSGYARWLQKNNIKADLHKLKIFFHIPTIEHLINTDLIGRTNKVLHSSRAVAWKRAALILDLHPHLKDAGIITELMGFERSIAGFTQLDAFSSRVKYFTTTSNTPEFTYEGKVFPITTPSPFSSSSINTAYMRYLDSLPQTPDYVYVIGAYDYFFGLQRLSNSTFASQPRTFQYNGLDYGNTFLEYQGIEAALLSAPIYHRHFLDNVSVPGTSTPLSSLNFFLSIDDDNRSLKLGGPQTLNPRVLVDELTRLSSNPAAYKSYRQGCVDFMSTHFATDKVVPKFVQELVEL